MIQLPRRSVTRFFIPMIDVLTLLFCMFLLMPIIRESAALSGDETGGGGTAEEWKTEMETRQRELGELYKDQERARTVLAELASKKRALVQQNVFIRLLFISPKNGTLWFYDPVDSLKQPLLIADATAAATLIERHRKEAGPRELFYIFQEPRVAGGDVAPYPTLVQEAEYRDWFSTVNYDGCVKPPATKGAK